MDNRILIFSFASFISYLVASAVTFRFIHPDRALIWLIKLYCIVEGIALLAGYGIWNTQAFIAIACWQITIYSLLILLYVGSFFSFTEASITLRILMEIAMRSGRGITKNDIWKRYNTKTIIERRLSRFIQGGDIVKKGRVYTWKNSASPFILRQYIVSIVQFFFPHTR